MNFSIPFISSCFFQTSEKVFLASFKNEIILNPFTSFYHLFQLYILESQLVFPLFSVLQEFCNVSFTFSFRIFNYFKICFCFLVAFLFCFFLYISLPALSAFYQTVLFGTTLYLSFCMLACLLIGVFSIPSFFCTSHKPSSRFSLFIIYLE